MDYSSLLFSPGPDAAKMAAPQPNATPQTATPQYPPIPISYPVANPQEAVQGPQAIPPATGVAAAPAPEPAVAAPPAAPGLWEKFQHNPNLMQAALMSGLRLMHGQQNGQDTFGLVSDALMAGNLAYQYNEQNAVEDTRKGAESQALVKSRDTQTAATQQQIDQRAQEFPQTLRKLQLDIDNAATDGQRKRAEARMKEFESDQKRMADLLELDKGVKRANINQSNAAAGASGAAARASNALTNERQFNLGIKKEGFDTATTPERLAQIQKGYQLDDPQARSAVAKSDNLKQLIQEANPDWTKEQVASRALEMTGEAKANYLTAALKVLDNPDQYDANTVESAKQLVGQSIGKKTAAPTAAGGKAPVTVKNSAEWKALAPGTPYITADGKTGVR